jgi:oligo-1,6-glucosidase
MANWWQERVVYQIYPRSFQDTDANGIGDLQGIIRHLQELKDLGIGIIWLSPVYSSPNRDYGYDISDYCSIHPGLGTMADMDQLIAEAKRLDIKLVMDLVINHTSDEHEWFMKSRNPQSPYRDYYIWRPGIDGGPPNNWTSFFAEDCWQFDPISGEYYLHLFSKKQPDLNYRNPAVLEEVENIMRFWLDKGISGFRCDVINIICKDSLENGRKRLILTGSEHYLSRDGAHEVLRRLRRDVLDHYDCFAVGETVFVTPKMARDFCDKDRGELDMIFYFEHMDTDQYIVKWIPRRFHAGRFGKVLTKWQTSLDWNANYLENHDQPRSVSRFGDDKKFWAESAKMLAVLLLSLRGTPYIYQGQELGMTNFDYTSIHQISDVESHNVYKLARQMHLPKIVCWQMIRMTGRDNARTPMQWNAESQAGFTTGKPWIGINSNYRRINVEAQTRDPLSVRSFYKTMIALRAQNDALLKGSFRSIRNTRRLIAFERTYNNETLTILLSFSKKRQRIFSYRFPFFFSHIPAAGTILLSTYGKTTYDGVLEPYEAIIMRNEASI